MGEVKSFWCPAIVSLEPLEDWVVVPGDAAYNVEFVNAIPAVQLWEHVSTIDVA